MEQAFSHVSRNGGQPWMWLLFLLPALGAGITPFYMFRLWYMTFAGEPNDHHRYYFRKRLVTNKETSQKQPMS